jgi:glutathione synthase
MESISPPEGIGNYLVLPGKGVSDVVKTEVVSELGIFGWCLFGSQPERLKYDEVGWLLRTKKRRSDEGGIANGSSVYDSLVLLDS